VTDMTETLPGLARVREKFLSLLDERCSAIAEHNLSAWQATDHTKQKSHLSAAGTTLHQIAGSAGSLGLEELGEAARCCEEAIIAFVSDPASRPDQCSDIVMEIDSFVTYCQDQLAQSVPA